MTDCRLGLTLGAAALALIAGSACADTASSALTVYPLGHAAILAGQHFDFKVEFPGAIAAGDAKVTINGGDPAKLFGKAPTFIDKEPKVEASALILRDVALTKPGRYEVVASDGTNSKTVVWEVYDTPAKPKAKNVILFIGDGMSVGHRTAARILRFPQEDGKYQGKLAMDDMPAMALLGTQGSDSIITDSANSAHAYTSGHKSAVNALGVYADRTPDPFDDPKVELISEIAKRERGLAVGIVSNAELEDATPAAMAAHTRRRDEKAAIAEMLFNLKPEVLLGGGSAYFLPKATLGSKRKDEKNLVEAFQQDGYTLATTDSELLQAADKGETRKLLGLFHPGNMDGALDRKFLKVNTVPKFPHQPDLTEMTKAALEVLSRNPNGFVLMVESALIDKFTHPLDWERAIYDTIMLDESVRVAKDWAASHPDTLIMVTPDHTHAISVVGTVDDDANGELMRDKVGVYAEAGHPNYTHEQGLPYPDRVDVSKRLFMTIGDYPDHYETWRPKLDGTFNPAIKGQDGLYHANETYKDVPGAQFMPGNLPRDAADGVHAADDGVITATGPGSEQFHGFLENTDVFRIIATTLALGPKPAAKSK